MKIRSRPPLAAILPAILCILWFGTAGPAPAVAFDAGPAPPPAQSESRAQSKIWAQFFEKKRRRSDSGNQRRQRRNYDVMPLRSDPGEQQPRMPEFRRQERNRNQRQEQDAAREAVRRGDILPLGGIIRSVRSQCPGKFLGATLQRGRDGLSYRVRILRPSGQRVGLTVDAKTGAVVGGGCR